ncbi:MAG: MoaD/ThiS family protein [Sulfuritalea sp.]|nr:MoaD/ThiS family protein [Sulfuritalea sp.]
MAATRITFKLFATLQDYLPPEGKKTNALTLDLEDGTTVTQLVKRFSLPEKLVHLVLIDGNFVPPADRAGRVLRDGETLAIWPPVAGG